MKELNYRACGFLMQNVLHDLEELWDYILSPSQLIMTPEEARGQTKA